MSRLKRALFDFYGGFADKRIKNIDKGTTFIVDSRSASDLGADRKPFATFCMIFADVVSEAEVRVNLSGNIPVGERVREWLAENELTIRDRLTKALTIKVTPGTQGILDDLADALMSIVSPGASWYDVPSYKYACPQTAGALKQLKQVLDSVWAKAEPTIMSPPGIECGGKGVG